MLRTGLIAMSLTASLLGASDAAAAPSGGVAQAGAAVTAAEADPFLGHWTLTLQGEMGPGTFDLAVTVEKDKVVGEITGPGGAPQPIEHISMAGKSLALSYSFDYEGSPVDALVRLTPAAEGGMGAEIAFAGGAYVMSGTATRKEPSK